MTAASRSLATALWGARFASGLLLGSYTTTCGVLPIAINFKSRRRGLSSLRRPHRLEHRTLI